MPYQFEPWTHDKESKTPRTDEQEWSTPEADLIAHGRAGWEWARQLEEELNELIMRVG